MEVLGGGFTETLEVVGGSGEEEVVSHFDWIRTRRDARLQIVFFDPIGQPLEVAIAVEWVVAKTAEIKPNNKCIERARSVISVIQEFA